MRYLVICSLFACSGEASQDTGSPSGPTGPGAAPPAVAEGEIAIDLDLDGQPFPVRCDAAHSPQASVSDFTFGGQPAQVFILLCSASPSPPMSTLALFVRTDTLAVGATTLEEPDGYDEVTAAVTDADGNGYSLDLTNYIGGLNLGTLHMDEIGASGGRMRGSFELNWDTTGIIESGVTVRYDPIPGSGVGAFDLLVE